MAIEVSVGEPNTQEVKPFPKLMQDSDGDIFYFIREGYGLPLSGSYNWNTQDLAVGWDMEDFTDFNEPLEIQNSK